MSGAAPEFRVLGASDAAAFLAIRERSLRDDPEAYHSDLSEWEGRLDRVEQLFRENVAFGAFSEGVPCGLAVLGMTARTGLRRRHKAEVWAVYVTPEQRGRGIARTLMRMVLHEAAERGYRALVLTVEAGNGTAVALYESLGFTRYGMEQQATHLRDDVFCDDVLMQCELRGG
jgi:ribosomal protein S18 acetylase RimI-like enzyme